jgi:hypothetical protein
MDGGLGRNDRTPPESENCKSCEQAQGQFERPCPDPSRWAVHPVGFIGSIITWAGRNRPEPGATSSAVCRSPSSAKPVHHGQLRILRPRAGRHDAQVDKTVEQKMATIAVRCLLCFIQWRLPSAKAPHRRHQFRRPGTPYQDGPQSNEILGFRLGVLGRQGQEKRRPHALKYTRPKIDFGVLI